MENGHKSFSRAQGICDAKLCVALFYKIQGKQASPCVHSSCELIPLGCVSVLAAMQGANIPNRDECVCPIMSRADDAAPGLPVVPGVSRRSRSKNYWLVLRPVASLTRP